MAIEAFDISFGDDELAELRSRLLKARMPLPSGDAGTVGFEPSRLSELVARWATTFDWRAQERRLNAVPHFRTTGEHPLHFVHLRAASTHAEGLPVLLAHGWPSSFVEMLPLAERLSDPGRFGATRGMGATSSSRRCPVSCSAPCSPAHGPAAEPPSCTTG